MKYTFGFRHNLPGMDLNIGPCRIEPTFEIKVFDFDSNSFVYHTEILWRGNYDGNNFHQNDQNVKVILNKMKIQDNFEFLREMETFFSFYNDFTIYRAFISTIIKYFYSIGLSNDVSEGGKLNKKFVFYMTHSCPRSDFSIIGFAKIATSFEIKAYRENNLTFQAQVHFIGVLDQNEFDEHKLETKVEILKASLTYEEVNEFIENFHLFLMEYNDGSSAIYFLSALENQIKQNINLNEKTQKKVGSSSSVISAMSFVDDIELPVVFNLEHNLPTKGFLDHGEIVAKFSIKVYVEGKYNIYYNVIIQAEGKFNTPQGFLDPKISITLNTGTSHTKKMIDLLKNSKAKASFLFQLQEFLAKDDGSMFTILNKCVYNYFENIQDKKTAEH
jgi:hypothetical protein